MTKYKNLKTQMLELTQSQLDTLSGGINYPYITITHDDIEGVMNIHITYIN